MCSINVAEQGKILHNTAKDVIKLIWFGVEYVTNLYKYEIYFEM